jgi:hypothetical protein
MPAVGLHALYVQNIQEPDSVPAEPHATKNLYAFQTTHPPNIDSTNGFHAPHPPEVQEGVDYYPMQSAQVPIFTYGTHIMNK